MTLDVPFARPSTDEAEVAAVAEVLRDGWLSTGPRTQQFAEQFAKLVDAPATLPVSSCTAALHLALLAGGVGPKSEVITTPWTFAATANVIEHVGARPVFADVDPSTLNIDPELVAAAVTSRTKAVIAVHFAGHPCEMDRLREICQDKDLILIEDAAHALVAKYKGQKIGSWGNLSCFSFYATKNLTTGEGGMIAGSADLVEGCRSLALHGMNRDAWKRYAKGGTWEYDVATPGWKYNMTDLEAAIGLIQLNKFQWMQDRRRHIWSLYNEAFEDEPSLAIPTERAEVESALHLYVLRLRPGALKIGRDELLVKLGQVGIGTSVHFIPLHTFSFYKEKYGYAPPDFPVAWTNFQAAFSLPLYPNMTDEQVQHVIRSVRRLVHENRR